MYEQHTILIAEDVEEDVLLLRLAFDKADIKASLQFVRNGQAAVAYLSGEGVYADRIQYPMPRLVLLDLKMPIMSGYEVLKWRQGRRELRHIPVVAFSSSVLEKDIGEVLDLGASAYVAKPVGFSELIEVARAIAGFWLGQHLLPETSNVSSTNCAS